MKTRKKTYDGVKATMAARRDAFFAAGGTLAMWRGAATKFADKKHEQDRRSCRGSHSHRDD
jgi:hypothetical protein